MSRAELHHETSPREASGRRRRLADGRRPPAIEVRGVEKVFRVPDRRIDTLKERVTHPFSRAEYRELHALRDVSFDVYRGECFGIVGRNGSGKSTLLKILASIYRPDAGRVRIAGRVAPFIELGVGFNPEMTARENVTLNGVLFGLSRRESSRMLDAVLDFAELRDFTELKIKNYSSGMMVRLAFAIMVRADADVMLIDEVLAVGDAAFAQKCMEVFYDRRAAGRTIVLVTHDMATVQALCHRALLLHDGVVQYEGEPEQAAMRYYRLNFAQEGEDQATPDEAAPSAVTQARHVSLLRSTLTDADGRTVTNIEQDTPIRLDAALETARELADPVFVFHVRNAEGVVVSAFTRALSQRLDEGQVIRFTGEIENRLVPGTYALELWIREHRPTGVTAVQPMRLARFAVFGTTPRYGLVSLRADIEPIVEPAAEIAADPGEGR
jgi:ABC-type polysaccharide/polyol phosphate transport system ATPase subunit